MAILVCGTCSYRGESSCDQCACCGSRKTATQFDTQAWQLNPGDQIRNEIGQTMKVQRVRPHETNFGYVYVDTDQGTTLARRGDNFTVAPHNSAQQVMPGYGVPGANANYLPMDAYRNANPNMRATPGGGGGAGSGQASTCMACGSTSLVRQGDHLVCSRCGNTMAIGGASGHQFGNQTSITNISSYQPVTAVGLRAAALLSEGEISE